MSPELQQLSSQVLGEVGISSAYTDTALTFGKNLSEVRTELTPEEEYYLGRGVAAMVFSKYRPLNNRDINLYIMRVGRVVAQHSQRPETFNGYRFMVLDTEEVNAFAAPGGFVFVTKGLLKFVPDEDALAAVLAHEIAHVAADHGVEAIAQAKLTSAFVTVGKQVASSYTPADLRILTEAFGDGVSEIFETVLVSGYSRGQEYDSDEAAVQLASKAGYNPNGLAVVLTALADNDGEGGWYSTHPDAEQRLRNVRKISKPEGEETPGQSIRKKRYTQALRSLS
jgi:predicted Zn-dependent protease